MSFNQMKNAYQQTMKQTDAYKKGAEQKGFMTQAKKSIQPIIKPVTPATKQLEQAKDIRNQAVPTSQKTNSTNANTYKQNALSTASAGELTLLLYNGCLKFIEKANCAIEAQDIEAKHKFIIRAQDIIREFMVTLKTDSEVGKNMLRMYDYIHQKLIEANIKNDKLALKEINELVTDLRDTWKQAIKLDRKSRHSNKPKA